MVGDRVIVQRVRRQLGLAGAGLHRATGGATELGDPLGHRIGILVHAVTEPVEHLVDADELRAFQVPMRLLDIERERDAVGEPRLQRVDRNLLGVVGRIVAGPVIVDPLGGGRIAGGRHGCSFSGR